LKDNGGNFFETMMIPPWFGIEREALGNYASKYHTPVIDNVNNPGYYINRQVNAWELDSKIKYIEDELHIFCQLALDMSGTERIGDLPCNTDYHFENGGVAADQNWQFPEPTLFPPDEFGNYPLFEDNTGNPYNSDNRGNQGLTEGVYEMIDFFASDQSMHYYKRKLRYINARWGYSPHIISYEIQGEINNSNMSVCWDGGVYTNDPESPDRTYREIINNWVDVSCGYLKNELHDPHLLSASLLWWNDVTEQPFESENVDFLDYSMYTYDERDANLNNAARVQHTLAHYNGIEHPRKPILPGEYGSIATSAGTNPYDDECRQSDVAFHNEVWSSSMMGCFSSCLTWTWETNYMSNRYPNFLPLKRFTDGVDYEWNNFSPFNGTTTYSLPIDFSQPDSRIEYFYLKNQYNSQVMGWVHNRSAYWANVEENCYYQTDPDNDPTTNNNILHFCPDDDPDCHESINTIYSIPQNILVFEGLEYPLVYYLQWFNTHTGEYIGNPEELNTFPSGTAIIPLPDLSNVYDYAFKIWPTGPGGFRSNNITENTDTIKICNNTILASLSFLWNSGENVFFIDKKQIADNFVFTNTGVYTLKVINRENRFSYRLQVYNCDDIRSDVFYSAQNNILSSQVYTLNNPEIRFEVYPNPVKDYLIIEASSNIGKFDCKITDIAGSLVFSQSFSNSSNRINTEYLSRGAYIITLSKNDVQFHQKIILQ